KADSSQRETIARPMTDKERKKRDDKLRKELETPYRKWLNEDVAYIISDEERTAFKRLQTDEEREQFIEQFWLRRDPTPDTVENEFKEEHYRRIAYTNEHFASGIPGWKTDRGRIDLHVPVPTMALPVHRGRRDGRDDRIRRHHHVRRVPHDHGSFREGCPALHPRRRSHDVRANGHHEQDRPLHSHRRHAPRRSARRDDGKPEPIHPAGTVHQPAEAARREIQGSGGGRRHAYQL